MSIGTETRTTTPKLGNGVWTEITFSFKVFDTDEVVVVQTTDAGVDSTLTETTHYTVTLNANQNTSPGGTITLVSASTDGYYYTATSDVENLQPVQITNLGGFLPSVINNALDRLTILVQQVLNRVDRSIKIPLSDGTGITTELPTKTLRANKFPVFDASGNISVSTNDYTSIEADLTSLVAVIGDIQTLADIEDGTVATDAIQLVAAIDSDVTTVAGISANVTTVAGISANVTTVAGISANVTTVAGDSADVQALALITADIQTLADIEDGTVATNAIQLVAAIDSDVTTVAGISANVTTVAGISANVTTVAGISGNVTTVAGDSTDIQALALITADIQALADIEDGTVATNAIQLVAAIDSDVTTVAGISANVTTVSGISGNVTTVAGISANVTTVAGISANVTTVAGISADVTTVANNTAGLTAAINALEFTTVNAIGSIGGGTQDIDLDSGRAVSGTVDTSTTTFTFSNPNASGDEDIFTLRLTNGGSQTVNWPASVEWVGGSAPSLTAAGVDELVFKTIDGGTTWVGAALLNVS